MRILRPAAWILLLAARPAAAQTPPVPSAVEAPADRGPYMPLAEVTKRLEAARAEGKPLTGYGKTVFRGTKIERFDVEVLDIVRNFFPGQDVLLVRCSHPAIGQGPIIAGMSGSPVYLDDRVVGAVAYAWPFGREPIAGVTPIESMFADMDRPLETARGVGGWEREGVGTSERGIVHEDPPAPSDLRTLALSHSPTDVRPVRTPLAVSGLAPGAFARLEAMLRDTPFVPVRGGGGAEAGGGRGDEAAFEPGAAIGVQLVRGDIDFTGVGTLTWRSGNRILAFGHPMFGAGQIALPFTSARVHAVISSLFLPFKLASPGGTLGALVKDRNASIYGEVGGDAPMFPVRLRIHNRRTGAETVYRFEVFHHRLFAADFLGLAVMSGLEVAEPILEPNTVEQTITFRVKDREPLVLHRTSVHTAGAADFEAVQDLYGLLWNPFEAPRIEGLEIDAGVRREERVARILRAWPDRNEAVPGESVPIHLELRPFRAPDVRQTFAFSVPAGAEPGSVVRIEITAGAQTPPPVPPAARMEDLLEALRAEYPATAVVAQSNLPTLGLRYRGRVLDRLPRGVLGTLLPVLPDAVQVAQDQVRLVHETGYVVSGKAVAEIRIKP